MADHDKVSPQSLREAADFLAGILGEDFIDLTQATTHNLNMVAATPSSALGSCRDKPDLEYCQRIVEVFRKQNVWARQFNVENDGTHNVLELSVALPGERIPVAGP